MKTKKTGRRRVHPLIYAIVIAIVLVIGFPFYWMIDTAQSSPVALFTKPQDVFPTFTQLGQAFSGLSQVPIMRALANSAFIAVGTATLSVGLALLAAYALSRFRFHGRGFAGFLLFATQMVPAGIFLIPIYTLFIAIGLIDNLLGLVLVNATFAIPVSVFIIKTGIDSIPVEIDEAARVDNCSRFGILTTVIAPLVLPSIASAAVLAFFMGWGELMFASTYLSTQSLWPASVWLEDLVSDQSIGMPTIMLFSLIYCLPAIVFFHLVQRRIVSGLTAGAVKG